MKRRRDDMEGLDEKRERKRDREGGKFDVAELINDLAPDDDMGPDWWRLSRMDQANMLRMRGMSFRQIGEGGNVDTETARQYVRKVEREMAPQRKKVREQALSHAMERIQGLAIEAAAHYDKTHEAKLLSVRLRCEMELARLQGVYAIAQEAATHDGSESEGGLVPIRFFDASAAIDDITGGPAKDSESGE
jgi:hypothetical protein